MSVDFFQFKQFRIKQNNKVFKVGTDGVLLGAFANFSQDKLLLDAGTGTGLIALMAAQKKNDLQIHAIEKQKASAETATYNVSASCFSDRIQVLHKDFVSYAATSSQRYCHIVCNPPFFNNSILPKSNVLKTAKHFGNLTYKNLLAGAKKLLHDSGRLSLILPADCYSDFRKLISQYDFYTERVCMVKPTPDKPTKRVLLSLSRQSQQTEHSEIVIESKGRHQYSDEYKAICREFYLYF